MLAIATIDEKPKFTECKLLFVSYIKSLTKPMDMLIELTLQLRKYRLRQVA